MPVARWHEQIGDPAVADGILDRLVHNVHRIEMRWDSMRKLALTYLSYRDRESRRNIAPLYVAVRVAGPPLAIAARVREELRAIDPELPILKIYTVDQRR